MKRLAILSLTLVLLAGCRSHRGDEPPTPQPTPAEDQFPMVFSTASAAISRADGTPLQSVHTDFGVWAIKFSATGAQVVMQHADGSAYLTHYDTEHTADESHWIYQDLTVGSVEQYTKYWDLGAFQYYFAGYAPFFESDGTTPRPVTVDMSTGYMRIPGVQGHIAPADDVKWCVTRHFRLNSMGGITPVQEYDALADPNGANRTTLGSLTEKVPLVFHRILCSVEFRLENTGADDVTVQEITVRVVQRPDGEGIAAPDYIVTRADYSGSFTMSTDPADHVTTVAHGADLLVEGDAARQVTFGDTMEIPQNVGSRYFEVTIRLSDTETITQIFGIPEDWQPEKKYIYVIRFSLEEHDIILATVTVDDWTEGGQYNQTQTNW